jgi:hypothetical protein
MKAQSLLHIESLLAGNRVIAVDHPEGFQHKPAFLRKARRDVDKLPACVRKTVRQQDSQSMREFWRVPRLCDAHLYGRIQQVDALRQHIGQVLTGMLPPGKEQGNFPVLAHRNNAAGKDPVRVSDGSRASRRIRMPVSSFVKHFALRVIPDQSLPRRLQQRRCLFD